MPDEVKLREAFQQSPHDKKGIHTCRLSTSS